MNSGTFKSAVKSSMVSPSFYIGYYVEDIGSPSGIFEVMVKGAAFKLFIPFFNSFQSAIAETGVIATDEKAGPVILLYAFKRRSALW